MSLRYAIAHPDGRLFVGPLTSQYHYPPFHWTAVPERAAWFRSRKNAEVALGTAQEEEPEARLVEQETEDL